MVVGAVGEDGGELGALGGGHHRPGQQDGAPAVGQGGAGEGFGEGVAVLPATEEAEGVGGIVVGGGAGFCTLERVGVAEVGDGFFRGGEAVGGDGVVEAGVTVNPDGVVVVADGVEGAQFLPLTGDGCGFVDDVAQAEDDAATARALPGEAYVQFAERAAGDVIHDEEVGREGVQRGGKCLAAQGDEVIERDAQRAGAVAAVAVFAVGGQGDAVDAVRQRVGAGFADAGEEQYVRIERRAAQGAGEERGTADVAESHGVV